ncbi:unnamed protein product [Hapterophycus canaliculatus]
MRAQVAVAIDAPRATSLPKGKRIVRRKRTPPTTQPVHVDTSNAPVKLIKSRAEYEALLRENSDNLVVIKFFAPWCRSCKALDVKYRRMAVAYEDVKFVEVDVHQSPELKKALGVRAVPTVKLHAGLLGQVASFTCGPRKAANLERKIKLCRDVPALTSRLGKGTGMIEMLAGEMGTGKQESASPPLLSLGRPAEAVETGLMEKVARQEMQSKALQQQLKGIPMDDSL